MAALIGGIVRLLTLRVRQADIVRLLGFTERDGRLDFNASPFTLVGTTADMVAKLRDYRDAFGITYWVVGPNDIEPLKGVIEALAGS